MDFPSIEQFPSLADNDHGLPSPDKLSEMRDSQQIGYLNKYFEEASFIENGISTERWGSSNAFVSELKESLEARGMHGSALCMELLYDFESLHTQVGMLREGNLDPNELISKNIPLLINLELTTTSMLESGEVVLSEEFQEHVSNTTNQLRSYIPGYISRATILVADQTAESLAEFKIPQTPIEAIERITGQNSYSKLGVSLNQEEVGYLEERLSGGYKDRKEFLNFASGLVQNMIKNRPAIADLDGVTYLNKTLLPRLVEDLPQTPNRPVNISNVFDRAGLIGDSKLLDTLGIYPGYVSAMKDLILLDFDNE